MPTLRGTKASLSYVQCFLYLVSSSVKASVFQITWLDSFWIGHMYICKLLKNIAVSVLPCFKLITSPETVSKTEYKC